MTGVRSTHSLRVLHVISGIDPADGGPTMALLELARALTRVTVEVTVVATPRHRGHASITDELRQIGVRVRLSEYRGRGLNRNHELRETLTEEIRRADVVHIHALWEDAQYQAASIARSHGKPFIFRPCGLLDPWSMAQHRFKKRLYLELCLRRHLNAAAAIHYTTGFEETRARQLGIAAPTVVEPNGIDLEEFQIPPRPETFRDRFNIGKGVPIVLYLGRLHPKKGLDLLIRAFSMTTCSDAVLVIAGSGDEGYVASLRGIVAELGLGGRVKFVGFLQGREKIAAFVDSCVFALPSRSENFANTVLESLAAGTPVIVSDKVGLHADVASSKVGGVVSLDLRELSEELDSWMVDAPRRELARANARAFLKPYDVNRVAARWLARYRELTTPSSGAAALGRIGGPGAEQDVA